MSNKKTITKLYFLSLGLFFLCLLIAMTGIFVIIRPTMIEESCIQKAFNTLGKDQFNKLVRITEEEKQWIPAEVYATHLTLGFKTQLQCEHEQKFFFFF